MDARSPRPRSPVSSAALLAMALALTTLAAAGAAQEETDAPAVLQAGDHPGMLLHGGRERTWILHAPPGYDGSRPVPLVLVLHGGFGSGDQASRHYGWREKADAEGFLVAFPDGVGRIRTWNAGHCCGAAMREEVDDVGFVRALVATLGAELSVDPDRVYATGMSNGAMLAHRLGAELSGTLAAIVPVAGTVGGRARARSPVVLPPAPARPLPVMIVHGRGDRHVLYDGGPPEIGAATQRVDLSVADSAAFWCRANGCSEESEREVLAGGKVVRETWSGPDGADVVVITVEDQGHAWPGGLRGSVFLDAPSTALSATDAIWSFFAAHPRRRAAAPAESMAAPASGAADGEPRDLRALAARAASQRKSLMIWLEPDDAPEVTELDRTIQSDPDLRAAFGRTFFLERLSLVGARGIAFARELQHLPRRGSPCIAVVDRDGAIASVVDPESWKSGGRFDRDRIAAFVAFWAQAPPPDDRLARVRETYGAIYRPEADAKAEIAAAVARARAEGKHVLVKVGGNWCPWCYFLHDELETRAELRKLVEACYVLVRVSVDEANRNEAALADLGHPERFGYPVLVVLDGEGRRLHTQDTGLLERGPRHDPAKIESFLRGWTREAVAPAGRK